MERALELARRFRPHPNPRVGAVVVAQDGRVVGEGAHERPGTAHAEVVSLQQAGSTARGATVYVTLEPCSHHGHTPPCADALITAGISKVVVGTLDPDSRVAGTGVERLRAAGIEVTTGVLEEEALALDPGYFHHRRRGRPLLTMKAALTLDGQVAASDGTSQWITGEEARLDTHRLRSQADAVMIGAGTLLADDPLLDVRLPGYEGPQPRPVVVAGRRPPDFDAQLWGRDPVVISSGAWNGPGEPLLVAAGDDGLPDLREAVIGLGELGLLDVLIEAGPTLAKSLFILRLIDRAVFYFAGKLAGGGGRPLFSGDWPTLTAAQEVQITNVFRLGPDLRVDCLVNDLAG